MTVRKPQMGTSRSRLLGGMLVVGLSLAFSLSRFDVDQILLGRDAVEHVSIANALVEGHGFVNPIQWYFGVDGPPPLPAASSRAPLHPLFLAAGFALGLDLGQVMYVHLVFAALVGLGLFLIASRFARPGVAAFGALLVTTTIPWGDMSVSPLSELTGMGASLLVVATAAGAARSWRGALLCAMATVLAWLARPNLAPMALAVVVALAVDVKPLSRLVRSPVVLYVVAFVVGLNMTSWVAALLTGLPPYDGYRHAFENFPEVRAFQYGTVYVGTFAFVLDHLEQIARVCAVHAQGLLVMLFASSQFHFAGWFLLIGAVAVLTSPTWGTVEERVLLLSAVGFCAVVILTYPAFDRARYGLFPTSYALLLGMAGVERGLRWAEARAPVLERAGVRSLGWGALVVFVVLESGVSNARVAAVGIGSRTAELSRLCARIEPGALVMSDDPWTVHWACGNPVVRLPVDIRHPEFGPAFLDAYAPKYLVAYRSRWRLWGRRDPRMTVLGVGPNPAPGSRQRAVVFEVEGAPSLEARGIRPPQCLLRTPDRICAGRAG